MQSLSTSFVVNYLFLLPQQFPIREYNYTALFNHLRAKTNNSDIKQYKNDIILPLVVLPFSILLFLHISLFLFTFLCPDYNDKTNQPPLFNCFTPVSYSKLYDSVF